MTCVLMLTKVMINTTTLNILLIISLKFLHVKPFISLLIFCFFVLNFAHAQNSCNTAIRMDGVDDYIEFPSPYSVDQPLTIEMWILSQSTSMGNCNASNSENLDWILAFDDNGMGIVDCSGNLRFVFKPLCPFGNGVCSGLPPKPIDDTAWHHVAFSMSPSTGLKIYFDGKSFLTLGYSSYNFDGMVRLGRYFGTGLGNSFRGKMDEVRFWNVVRTDSEISENYQCKIQSDESTLIAYFDFEDGVPNEDNTSVKKVDNRAKDSGTFDGHMYAFGLTDTISNFVCAEREQTSCTAPSPCPSQCLTVTENLSTGVDYNNGGLLPYDAFDGSWRLVGGPDHRITYPRPSYVALPKSGWKRLPASQYITAFPQSEFQREASSPYIFERCFCICSDSAKVDLNMRAYVDNFLTVSLFREDGSLVADLIQYTGDSTGHAEVAAFSRDPLESKTHHELMQGRYCLRAAMRNDAAKDMGFSMEATLTGSGIIKNGCCEPYNTITGYVYSDRNCNGLNDEPQDFGLEDAKITLKNKRGDVVGTINSDSLGYFVFRDLPPGQYGISQETLPGKSMIQGSEGNTVLLKTNNAIGNVDFGNCTACCAASDVLSKSVSEGIKSTHIVDTVDHSITLRNPQLLPCQFISKIYWGDGVISQMKDGDPIPTHAYQEVGSYLISIEVTSMHEGAICQVDEVHFPLIILCISSSTEESPPAHILLYPNPASDVIHVRIGATQHNHFIVDIINTDGKVVWSNQIDGSETQTDFPIGGLASGMYLMQLVSANGETLSAKFIKI